MPSVWLICSTAMSHWHRPDLCAGPGHWRRAMNNVMLGCARRLTGFVEISPKIESVNRQCDLLVRYKGGGGWRVSCMPNTNNTPLPNDQLSVRRESQRSGCCNNYPFLAFWQCSNAFELADGCAVGDSAMSVYYLL